MPHFQNNSKIECKILERSKIDTSNTQIHDLLFFLALYKKFYVKLVLRAQRDTK